MRILTSHSFDKKSKFSRKRANEDEGDVTYINERNRVFNKKVRSSQLAPIRSLTRSSRLPVTTTSIRQRFGQASSVVQHYESHCLPSLSTTGPCTTTAYAYMYLIHVLLDSQSHVIRYFTMTHIFLGICGSRFDSQILIRHTSSDPLAGLSGI